MALIVNNVQSLRSNSRRSAHVATRSLTFLSVIVFLQPDMLRRVMVGGKERQSRFIDSESRVHQDMFSAVKLKHGKVKI